jgi:hypothetical protein
MVDAIHELVHNGIRDDLILCNTVSGRDSFKDIIKRDPIVLVISVHPDFRVDKVLPLGRFDILVQCSTATVGSVPVKCGLSIDNE